MKTLWLWASLVLVLVAAQLAAANKPDKDKEWKEYKQRFKKDHKDKDAKKRQNFEKRVQQIKKHNEEAAAKQHTYVMDANEFTDWDDEELELLKGFKPHPRKEGEDEFKYPKHPREKRQVAFPPAIDLRNNVCMAPIRDQGKCAACYAFAATSALEFALCARRGGLVPLSEQQLVDCSGQQGCTSGHYVTSWDYVYNAFGAINRPTYPYAEAATGTCRFRSGDGTNMPVARYYITGEDNMAATIANFGPIAVGFQAEPSLFSYKTGVYFDQTCDRTCSKANHAFTLVGYGTENGIPFWIMRNSWGSGWGEAGYAKIRRGVNACNIACWAARVA